jgi:hypothetical protein
MPAIVEKELEQASRESPSSRMDYGKLIEDSASTILNEQNPLTGLFPAATSAHQVKADDYHHSWVRDNSLVATALIDSSSLKIFHRDSEIGEKAAKSAVNFIHGMLNLSAEEPWKSAFKQESKPAVDQEGRLYRVLTRDAPPIHFETNGKPISWIRQNQPDNWGEFLISLGTGIEQKLLSLNEKQKGTTEEIVEYLLRIKVKELEQSSMWEGCDVHGPPPLSSVAIVAKGLEKIRPFVSDRLKEPIRRAASGSRKFIEENYPRDYTVPWGHNSETDVATLVAHDLGALDGLPLSQYFLKSNGELGDGQYPGKKRYKGDDYYKADAEAIWPLGTLLESKIYLERAISSFRNRDYNIGRKFQSKGLACLKKVIELKDKFGYIPELLMQRGGELVPNNNHLLWNEALVIQACVKADMAGSLNSGSF